MRLISSLLLLIISLCGRAQETMKPKVEVELKSKKYAPHSYKVLYQYYEDSQHLYTTRKINITRDGEIMAAMRVPVADDEVKNLGINKIAETADGFMMAADWGGGNYFCTNKYYFVFKAGEFYLRDIDFSVYIHEPESTETHHKKLNPPVAFSEIDLLRYMWKE